MVACSAVSSSQIVRLTHLYPKRMKYATYLTLARSLFCRLSVSFTQRMVRGEVF